MQKLDKIETLLTESVKLKNYNHCIFINEGFIIQFQKKILTNTTTSKIYILIQINSKLTSVPP